MQKTDRHGLLEWSASFLVAFVAVLLVRIFLVSPYVVEGASMDPTLENGEKLVVNKVAYLVGTPDLGDIVIIQDETTHKHYVKRVVGLPGDTIEVINDQLFVNGKPIKEPYLNRNKERAHKVGMALTGNVPPQEIPEGKVFVMGDNRLKSMDSRNGLGLIDVSMIVGRTELVVFPFEKIRDVD